MIQPSKLILFTIRKNTFDNHSKITQMNHYKKHTKIQKCVRYCRSKKKTKIICYGTKCVSTAFGTMALAFIYHFWGATNFVVFNIARIEILMAGMACATLCSLALDKVFTALPRLIHTTSWTYVKFKTLKTILNHVTLERKSVRARKNARLQRGFFARPFFQSNSNIKDKFYTSIQHFVFLMHSIEINDTIRFWKSLRFSR